MPTVLNVSVPRQHTVEKAVRLFLFLHQQMCPFGHLTLEICGVLLHYGHHVVKYVRLSEMIPTLRMSRWIHAWDPIPPCHSDIKGRARVTEKVSQPCLIAALPPSLPPSVALLTPDFRVA